MSSCVCKISFKSVQVCGGCCKMFRGFTFLGTQCSFAAAGLQLVDCCLGSCYHDNTLIVATAAEIYVGIVSLKWKGILLVVD